MPHSESDPLLSVGKAALAIGVDRSTLTRQIAQGKIRSHEGKVRLSEVLADRAANIDLTRSHRGKGQRSAADASTSDASADAPLPDATSADATDALPDGVEPDDIVIVDGQPLPFPVARALKETYLARLRQLEFQVKSGSLVDRAAAAQTFFECSRESRDAWIAWPARIAVTVAAEMGVDARLFTTVIGREVSRHLAEQGEPHADGLAE